MNELLLISIIIPAYQCEFTIEETIRSLEIQSYRNWEAIVVNDCSKDNTEKIVKQLSLKDSRIKYYKNSSNMGVANTRNIGLKYAKGSIIGFLDSDDVWHPEKLEKQINIILNKKSDLVCTSYEMIDQKGRKLNRIHRVPEKINYKIMLRYNIIGCSTLMIKRKVMEKYPFEFSHMHEDYFSWLRMLKDGYEAYGLDEVLVKWRLINRSKSRNKFKSLKMNYAVYKELKLGFPSIFINMCFYVLHGLRKYGKHVI